MDNINKEIGERIRVFRKRRNLTLEELSLKMNKGKSTLSKYENGEISIDIETLYKLADALQVRIEQLLSIQEINNVALNDVVPTFFRNVSTLYSYYYDGRENRIVRCVIDIYPPTDEGIRNVDMYMNFASYERYKECESTYYGTIEHYDALSCIRLENCDTPMEKVIIQISASFLYTETKLGLFTGFSSRPMMPVSCKMLFSKNKLNETNELIEKLKVNKEDIRLMKMYNMMCVL